MFAISNFSLDLKCCRTPDERQLSELLSPTFCRTVTLRAHKIVMAPLPR